MENGRLLHTSYLAMASRREVIFVYDISIYGTHASNFLVGMADICRCCIVLSGKKNSVYITKENCAMKICCGAIFRKSKKTHSHKNRARERERGGGRAREIGDWTMAEERNGIERKPQFHDGCIENAYTRFDFDIVESIYIYKHAWSIAALALVRFATHDNVLRFMLELIKFSAAAIVYNRRSATKKKECISLWNVLSFMHCISHELKTIVKSCRK